MIVLITGASGFVGGYLTRLLLRDTQHSLILTGRADELPVAMREEFQFAVDQGRLTWGKLGPGDDLAAAFADFATPDVLIHLAARVHQMHDNPASSERLYLSANAEFTADLARWAGHEGVKRFVFVSTIKVLGEKTEGNPFSAQSVPAPRDPYARSKLQAEQAVLEACSSSPMESVIIRPTLVYGPGAAGNIRRAVKLIDRGIPLPFASVRNRRSMLSVENLTSLVVFCMTSQKAAGGCLLAADAEAVSTAEFFAALALGRDRPARLFSVPGPILEMTKHLPKVGPLVARLTESLEVDVGNSYRDLGWHPHVTTRDGLRNLAKHLKEH